LASATTSNRDTGISNFGGNISIENEATVELKERESITPAN